ncbi:dCMP deaminase [Hathewaya proteolytica DSM 3090]|uniref:dCMP deaminase n=1 Tax=Hathewaya proteolytica DSM 3090 TaxID=1121331 RepID=A0A1M6S9N1_9CLOT|nr:deaminase [Hathewaya proteolytica]SHK41228.1 dCMP deaminase [Hathewaya proteolytica DSM 3090]
MDRIDKCNYYLDIAEVILERGTCLRKNYGSVIVKNDEIISTGYTGSPRGTVNCTDLGRCMREELNIERGTHYELCRSVHSEANAIISASRSEMLGASLFLVGKDVKTGEYVENANSCIMCKRLIINAGICQVVIRDTKKGYRVIQVKDWVEQSLDIFREKGY